MKSGKLADKLSGALELEKQTLLKDIAKLKVRLKKIKTFQQTLAQMNHRFLPTEKITRRRRKRVVEKKKVASSPRK